MNEPKEFAAIHKETGEIIEYNKGFKPYVPYCTTDPYDHYIDTRYKAKLRLYNYITFTKQGLKIPSFKPFENTEIGKSIPILNF